MAEDLFGEVNRHTSHRGLPFLDPGMGPHLLPDPEGLLEKLVQAPRGRPALQGRLVGFLDLSENLGLPEHHRINPRNHAAEVPGRFRPVLLIEMFRPEELPGVLLQEGTQMITRHPAVLYCCIILRPVAGGEHHALLDSFNLADPLRFFPELALRYCKELPYLHGSGLVIEAKTDDVHFP